MPDTITGAGLFFRLFIESNAAFALTDGNGTVLMVNDEYDRIIRSLALPEDRSPELLLRDISGIGEQAGVSIHRQNDTHTMQVRDGNGQDRYIRITAWRINHDPSAQPPEQGPFLGIHIRDITGEWKEEQRLKDDVYHAGRALEAKNLFLANMSHEIRTPIQTITGMAELLQDTDLDQEQAEYSSQIKFSAEVLLSLINDILDYSKTEAGQVKIETVPFDLEPAIVQAVEMIAPEAHKKGLEIIVDIPPDLDVRVRGDPDRFRQIVINLAKNAVKFTNSGEVIITARWTELSGKGAVRVAVADTGIGVPEAARKLLFTTFFQADPTNTRRFGGTGLGLAISKNLVDLMGGTIGMIPNTGGGSIFHFTVPLEKTGEIPFSAPACPSGIEKKRILVVDDRASFRRNLRAMLGDLEIHSVDEAAFGEEALEEMRAAAKKGAPCDIIFIDQIMQPMDGWRLAAEINADPEINGTQLVLMTPHGLPGTETKMKLLRWFSAYIYKPVTRRRLAAVMEDIVSSPLAEPGETAAAKNPAGESGTADPVPPETKKNILVMIVEDNPVNQNLFRLFVTRVGYRAITADDGVEALEKAAQNEPDMIFMDIQMPRMNGYEAASALRGRGFTKPLIAVTASALADERERCLETGFDDILIKPFKRPDIQRALEKWEARLPEKNAPGNSGQTYPEKTKNDLPASAFNDPAFDDSVFDGKDLFDTFLQEKDMAASMIRRFIRRTEDQIAESIPASLENGDWETGRREAHTIKGAAFQMSGKETGAVAAILEKAFRDQDRAAVKETLPELCAAFSRFRRAAEIFLREENR